MNNNLYAFGDSFCFYAWPMWPELVGINFQKTHNYGWPGSGNFYIFYKLITELSSVKLTSDDVVIVQWSEPLRHDFVEESGYWTSLGIGSAELFVKKKIDHMNSDVTVTLKHLSLMLGVAEFLSKKKCQWYFIFMSDSCMSHKTELEFSESLMSEYKKLKNKLFKYRRHILDQYSISSSREEDGSTPSLVRHGNIHFYDDHPTPRFTASFLEKIQIPNLNLIKIKNQAEKYEKIIEENKIPYKNTLVNNLNTLGQIFKNEDT